MTDENSVPAAKKGRGPGVPFQKGRSGNPAGRPALFPEFREQCRAHSPEALARLLAAVDEHEIVDGKKVPIISAQSIKAAELILAYGWGRPTQVVDVQGELTVTIEKLVMSSFERQP